MTSVARKTHMPSEAVSCCCSRLAYCSSRRWRTSMVSCSMMSRSSGVKNVDSLSFILRLFQVVLVGSAENHGCFVEVVLGRGRERLPFQSRSIPRIRPGLRPPLERIEEIKQRNHVTGSKDRRAGGGHDVPDLELRSVAVIAAR